MRAGPGRLRVVDDLDAAALDAADAEPVTTVVGAFVARTLTVWWQSEFRAGIERRAVIEPGLEWRTAIVRPGFQWRAVVRRGFQWRADVEPGQWTGISVSVTDEAGRRWWFGRQYIRWPARWHR